MKLTLGSAIVAATAVASLAAGVGTASADEPGVTTTATSSDGGGQEPSDTPTAPDPQQSTALESGLGGRTYSSREIAAIQNANAQLAAATKLLAPNGAPDATGSGHEPADTSAATDEATAQAALDSQIVTDMQNSTNDSRQKLQEIQNAEQQAIADSRRP